MPLITEHGTTVELGEAFYNPHTTLDRGPTIASLAAFGGTVDSIGSYLGTFAATGIRGLRAASEIRLAATINDRDPDAARLIRQKYRFKRAAIILRCHKRGCKCPDPSETV